MLEWLAVATGVELGQLVLQQVLNLTTSAMEDYVQNFFKDCLAGGVARLKANQLRQPMAEAIGVFIQQFVKELQANDVPDTSINHFYGDALKKFVRDAEVRALLGQAFVYDNPTVNFEQLQQIWEDTYLDARWLFPKEDFRWRRITQKYQEAVAGIVEANEDLRAILGIQLQKTQTALLQQVAGRSVDFNLAQYRDALLEQYGALKLDSLGSSQYEREGTNYRNVSLWQVFVAQEARECQDYLPQTYEVPKEHLRRLQQAGDMEILDEMEAQKRQSRYGSQIPRSILDIVGWQPATVRVQPPHPYLVILGDPGSGKSTLLRYLAVCWAQQPSTAQIPLLIELRGYSQSRAQQECRDFVEFVHKGSEWVNHLNEHQLETWLTEGNALVMFDGLDEVVDRQQRGTVLTQIHSFTQRYPSVPVIVTSRVIGYSAQTLRDAGFQHFMLQDLTSTQIEGFVQRWHHLTYADGAERDRKRDRLKQAITRSPAIQELAGNPLLLTLMAILNRGEELPRDRARLYEKAAEVLLYQWDVEEKLLKDPKLEKYPIEIDRQDKQGMLRRVAATMQNSAKGLAGNFIRYDDLKRCLTGYLKDIKEAPNAPSIAALIIDQLRYRNFVLCSLGGDAYAFVHRTFLEFFCAAEIKERFDARDRAGGLNFEQLRDQIFAPHWQDGTWHEVLRLVTGMVKPVFAQDLIAWLMEQALDPVEHLEGDRLKPSGLMNLLLAADCVGEVRDRATLGTIPRHLLARLKTAAETEYPYRFSEDAARAVITAVTTHWPSEPEAWLKTCLGFESESYLPEASVAAIAQLGAQQSQIRDQLTNLTQTHANQFVRSAAVQELARGWKDDPDTLTILKTRARDDENGAVRSAAVQELARGWKADLTLLELYRGIALHDPFERESDWQDNPRQLALNTLITQFSQSLDARALLADRAAHDPDEPLRQWAQKQLEKIQN